MEKETVAESNLKRKTRRLVERFSNRYLLLRSFFGLTLFTISFAFFTPILSYDRDLARLFIVLYGLIVLALCKFIFVEFFVKTVRLQNDGVGNYSALISINSFLGLIIPLFYFNTVLSVVVDALAAMRDYGSFLCQLRHSFINLYDKTHFYWTTNTLIFNLVLATLLILLVGGFVENLVKNHKK